MNTMAKLPWVQSFLAFDQHFLAIIPFMSRMMTVSNATSLTVRAYLFGFVLAVVPSLAQAQSTGQAGRPLRVAYLSTSATMASVWMTKEIGAFAKEGLDIEVLSMSSSSAIPALIANEIDVVQVSAAPVITASLRGIDVVFIAGLLNTMKMPGSNFIWR